MSAGTATVSASCNGVTVSAAATVTPITPGPVATVSLSVDPTSIAADGQATATATAIVKDAQGNPRAGDTVVFSASPTTGVEISTVTDNDDGTYSVNMRRAMAGVLSLTATDGGVSGQATLTLTAVTVPVGPPAMPPPILPPTKGGGGRRQA